MEDVLEEPPRSWLGRIPNAVIASLVTALVVGGGAFYVGHEVGEHDAQPRADFIREQQADVINRLEAANRRLVEIEQSSLALLVGKTGAEVDTAAFIRFHTEYTQAYDAVIGQVGRVNSLFGANVRKDAKAIIHNDNVALSTLFVGEDDLAVKNRGQMNALIVTSHAARKGQWAAMRIFTQDATTEMIGGH